MSIYTKILFNNWLTINFTVFFFTCRGRENKGRLRQQQKDGTEEASSETKEVIEGAAQGNQTEKGKKGRPKSPCEPIESEPYVNIEIVKYGRDPNNTFSSGKTLFICVVG